jgi:hypothetical protein
LGEHRLQGSRIATIIASSSPGGPAFNGTFDLPFQFDFMAGTGSYVAGLQGGSNRVFPSRLMLGVEIDASFPNSDVVVPFSVSSSQTVASPQIGQVTYSEAVIHYESIRGRIGYAFARIMIVLVGWKPPLASIFRCCRHVRHRVLIELGQPFEPHLLTLSVAAVNDAGPTARTRHACVTGRSSTLPEMSWC